MHYDLSHKSRATMIIHSSFEASTQLSSDPRRIGRQITRETHKTEMLKSIFVQDERSWIHCDLLHDCRVTMVLRSS